MWQHIQEDDGYVKQLFDKAKAQLTEYLETGIADGFSGIPLWDVQKDFSKELLDIRNFVDKVCSKEYLDIPDKYYPNEVPNFLCNTSLNVDYPQDEL